MKARKYLLLLAFAQLAAAGAPTTAGAAPPRCPGPPPPPMECMRVICIVGDQSWDYVPLPAGTSCRQGTGACDGQGTCFTPPQPASLLAGLYLGTIHADANTSAPIAIEGSGSPENLTARLDLGPGAKIDCHGLRSLPPTNGILLRGHRTGVSGDGGTTYWFSGRFTLFDVDILVSGARLSPDSTRFTGTAQLRTGDCTRYWPFETSRVEQQLVPSVTNMSGEEAFAALQAEGFTVRSIGVPNCDSDLVVRQDPPAGTLAPPASRVHVYIGEPPAPPVRCP
jgi:hypothetical protein